MSWFTKSYFVRSTTTRPDDTNNENWTVVSMGWTECIVAWVNKYRHDLENEHGGRCMITELRRI